MTTERCPATHPAIEGGAQCKYLAGHEAVVQHMTQSGIWWVEPEES